MEIKNKKIIFAMSAVVLFSLFISLFAVGVSAYVSLAAGGQIVPSVIGPGEKTNLVLTIANNGNEVASNVKLKFKSNPAVTPDQSSYDLGSIAAANSQVVTVPIKVSDAAAEGTTALVFTIEYTAGSASGATTVENSISISITKRIQIQIEDVRFSKDVIQQGDDVNFDFTIKNVGKGALKDLRVSLEDYTLPFVYLTNENFIGNIGAGQSAKTSFNIIINKEAKTIAYNLPITLNYYDEAGLLHTDKKYVGIKISGKPEFVVSIDKTGRSPRKLFEMT